MESLLQNLANLKYTTHLMIPLTGTSVFSVQSWLIDAWLSRDKEHLVLLVSKELRNLWPGRPNQNSAEYLGEHHQGHLYRLKIMPEHLETVELFLAGKYSQFPEHSRRQIIALSGLPYKIVGQDNLYYSHVLLVAINPEDTVFREDMARQLSLDLYDSPDVLDPSGELLSPPETREQVFYPQ